MKKIVLYTSGQLGKTRCTGGVRRFIELLNGLSQYCELTFMSGDISYPIPDGVRHISMNQIETFNKEGKYAVHNLQYLRKLKKEKYDTIVVFDVPPAIWLSIFRIPYMTLMVRKDFIGYEKIRFSENNVNKLKKNIILRLFKTAEAITMIHAKKIIVQCEYDKKELMKRHRILSKCIEKKTAVQINNVNPSWAKEVTQLNKTDIVDEFNVASVNDFTSTRKGCDIFLQAIAELIEEGIPIKGCIAGDGKLLEGYKETYKQYKQIRFVGRVKNPSEFIKKMDLAVVPSRADSCPNTIMEALYNEVPVIGAKAGGIPEILEDEMALFLPNPQALKDKILFFYNYRNREKLLKRQQKRKEELSFDWVKEIEQKL